MILLSGLLLFITQFFFVLLKAYQQRNVGGLHWESVLPTSLLMATFEFLAVGTLAVNSVEIYHTTKDVIDVGILIAMMGLGGGLGALSGMYLHSKKYTGR